MRKTIFSDVQPRSLFKNKSIFDTRHILGIDEILHREREKGAITDLIKPIFRTGNPMPFYVSVVGLSGTGKTSVVRAVLSDAEIEAKKRDMKIIVCYVNVQNKKNEYAVLQSLLLNLGVNCKQGFTLGTMYRFLEEKIQDYFLILSLDEADSLDVKELSGLLCGLYNLSSNISIILIANNVKFLDNLDTKAKSRFGKKEIHFESYEVNAIGDVLKARAENGLNVIHASIIFKCAAIIRSEMRGDMRQAIDLYRCVYEMAENGNNTEEINEGMVMDALEKLRLDHTIDTVAHLPRSLRATLYAIMNMYNRGEAIYKVIVYPEYENICKYNKIVPTKERNFFNFILDLAKSGLIQFNVVSEGRGGRRGIIVLDIENEHLKNIYQRLQEEFG